MNKISGIYLITNRVNNKQYIGQSVNIYYRWKQYKYNYKTGNSLLYKDMQQYGFENFEFKIIEKCHVSLLNEKEKYYIKKYNTLIPNGYNQNKGGHGYTY